MARLLRGLFERLPGRVQLTLEGMRYDIAIEPEAAGVAASSASGGSGAVLAPMPGVVAEVGVAVGERVEIGQVLVVLESMKLFTSLQAQIAGQVVAVDCAAGQTVPAGKRLVTIEAGVDLRP